MAYIGFDLDNTLGFFETVGPIAYLLSPEFLSNPEEKVGNPPLNMSRQLKNKLAYVRNLFAANLLKSPKLLDKVLRPNLDALIKPILEAKRGGLDVTVVIYSNTGNCFSTHFAKTLIEKKYNCPGLISLVADVFHPLRSPETTPAGPGANGFLNPEKTYPVLESLFQSASKRRVPIHPGSVAFVDDRTPIHRLAEEVPNGLTYIKPEAFVPKLTARERREIFTLALDAMDRVGLLSNDEYLASGICNRDIVYNGTRTPIRGFPDIFSYVWSAMNRIYMTPRRWSDDTFQIAPIMRRFVWRQQR